MAATLREYLFGSLETLPASISVEEAVTRILELHRQRGGATFNLYFGEQLGKRLYAVAVFPDRGRILNGPALRPEAPRAFLIENAVLLADPRV